MITLPNIVYFHLIPYKCLFGGSKSSELNDDQLFSTHAHATQGTFVLIPRLPKHCPIQSYLFHLDFSWSHCSTYAWQAL